MDQLTIQALNGTNSEKELKSIGTEIDQILEHVVYLANTKEQGRYLFGGDSVDKLPFTKRWNISRWK